MGEPKINYPLVNDAIRKNLENIIIKKVFSNGYIFYGPVGIGKKETALQFIYSIFKQYSSSSKIEEKINKNNHPDFLYIEPTHLIKGKLINRSESELSNNKEIIRIDQIRFIKKFLSQKSIESEKKIVLIDDAHLLNEASSNCLLKTLEEPTNGIFILLTSNINKILNTIISRCQLVRFKSYSSQELKVFMKNNFDFAKYKEDKELDIQYLINSSSGSPGKLIDNLKILDAIPEEIQRSLDLPITDYLKILQTSKLISEKLEINQQIFLINFIQNKWWVKTSNPNLISKLENLKSHLNNYVQPRLAWEVTLLNISLEDL